jgi:pilus assembly protein CpaF
MVNGPDDVFVERKGRIERERDGLFEGEEAVLHVIERIVAPLGLRVDESSPWVDARLPDGSRVHAIIPPLSLCGPVLTIRKFSLVPFTAEDLVRFGTLAPRMLLFLSACVRARVNVVISGGASSGKTTLLNVLSSFVADTERLITIEDAAELRLAKPHVVGLEARPPNVEGRGAVTLTDLVRQALRMRPDRLVVGEVRGAEVRELLTALNTGHEGGCGTLHANSAREVPARLEALGALAGMSREAVHAQAAGAVSVVLHLRRVSGLRRIVEVGVVERPDRDVVVTPALVADPGDPAAPGRRGPAYPALQTLLAA